ncbi:MAG: Ldh family oxidoreductase [Planctomycetota bacterium]|nr:Ldh family oxidoreductase [Planctomycetota bacterium]
MMGDYRFEAKYTVRHEIMGKWLSNLYMAAGMGREDSEICADTMVCADLRGVYSHGAMRAPIYAQRMREGGTSPVNQPAVAMDFQAVAVMDGKNAMGQVVSYRAMELAISKADKFGIGCVASRGSNHCGMLSYYSDMAQKKDMFGMAFTVGSANFMAPWGGLDARVGNNPYSVAFPAGKTAPVNLDMANSMVARGKVIIAAKTGTSIPDTWMLDAHGNPTTDPNEGLKGTGRPVGDYKGFGVAYVFGILSAMLSGAAFGDEIRDLYASIGNGQNLGQTMIAIDISKFVDLKRFKDRIDESAAYVKSSRKKPNAEIFTPGEPEYLNEARQRVDGIGYPMEVIRDLGKISGEFGIEALVKL